MQDKKTTIIITLDAVTSSMKIEGSHRIFINLCRHMDIEQIGPFKTVKSKTFAPNQPSLLSRTF